MDTHSLLSITLGRKHKDGLTSSAIQSRHARHWDTRSKVFLVCSLLEVDVALVPYSRHISRITHGHAATFLMMVNFVMRRIRMTLEPSMQLHILLIT